jgi:hypothetical protein
MLDQIDYRVALILPQSRQLLARQNDGTYELPTISIPRFRRPAEQLTRLIEKMWSIKTVVLNVLWDECLPMPFAVIEVRTRSWEYARQGFAAVSVDSVTGGSLSDSSRASLRSILADGLSGTGPFSQIGWVDRAQTWIKASVTDHEVDFTEDLRHLNAGGEFCLLRLGTTSGPAYWLKAVGEPNTHEFGVTAFLAKNCPQYLPKIVAARTDWNAWVMEEVGSPLHGSSAMRDFDQAVYRLASLQIELIDKSEKLLGVHCNDHRIPTLDSHIDELIAYLDEAMQLQTSTKVENLTSARLGIIRTLLHNTCSVLVELEIPDSLMHGDFNLGSILFDGGDCVFTDWCDAYVGNPFITFEQFCLRVARHSEQSQSWIPALINTYRTCWAEALPECKIDKALRLIPLISVLSTLYGRGNWLSSPRRHDRSFQGYARGLARHIDRTAQKTELLETLCQRN